MEGLLSFQDGDLQALRTRLDMLASGVATSINQQQALGRNLDAQAGAPIFVAGAGAGATSGINAGNIELSSALEGKPRALAAASSPVSVQISARQQGDLAVTSAQASAAVTLTKPTSLVFTDGAGAYEWRDAGGTALASGSWSAGTPISYAGVDFTLAGQPQAGEGFTVSPARENGNALLLAQLGNGALADGAVINDGYAQLISDVGTRAQGAQMAASVSAGVNEQAKAQLNSQTGVNLDEEAAKLIQYQQSYQAAAKVLQVAQKIFDTLLATTAG
jgi:flagellar hook-associated protein 1 FlgK